MNLIKSPATKEKSSRIVYDKFKTKYYKEAYNNFVETEESGKPVIGTGQIRSGLIEQSNTSFKDNMSNYQQAKMQMELVNALIKSNKELLEEAMRLVSS